MTSGTTCSCCSSAAERRPALRDLAEASGVARWVHLPGARSDLAAVLSAIDVVVSPSPQETFGCRWSRRSRQVVRWSTSARLGSRLSAPLRGVTQVPEDPVRLREAVMVALREPAAPAARSALGRYDVRTVAHQVDEVYAECLQRAGQTRRRTEPARDC